MNHNEAEHCQVNIGIMSHSVWVLAINLFLFRKLTHLIKRNVFFGHIVSKMASAYSQSRLTEFTAGHRLICKHQVMTTAKPGSD